MHDLAGRLVRVLRVLWWSFWHPPPDIAASNAERLKELDERHRAELAEFDRELRPNAQSALRTARLYDALSIDQRRDFLSRAEIRNAPHQFHSSSGAGFLDGQIVPLRKAPVKQQAPPVIDRSQMPYIDHVGDGVRIYRDGFKTEIP